MTENKINPLLEAMDNIDDNIIFSAQNIKKRHTHLKKTLIAAAAAAVLFAVGFTAAQRSEIRLKDGRTLDIQLEVQEDAVVPAGFDNRNGKHNIPPSRIFEMFNVSLLLNGNFIEPASTELYFAYSDGKVDRVQFVYEPVFKSGGQTVWISAEVAFSEKASANISYGDFGENAFRFIPLNNGSKALIFQKHTAEFTYNGVFYHIVELSLPDGEYDHNIESILEGLGIL